jgi:hypothetical protein
MREHDPLGQLQTFKEIVEALEGDFLLGGGAGRLGR